MEACVTAVNASALVFALLVMGMLIEKCRTQDVHVLALICASQVAFNMMHLGVDLHDGRSPAMALSYLAVFTWLAFRAGYRSNLQTTSPC